MQAATGIVSLDALRAAWAEYDVAGNDVNSRLWGDGGGILMMLRMRGGRR